VGAGGLEGESGVRRRAASDPGGRREVFPGVFGADADGSQSAADWSTFACVQRDVRDRNSRNRLLHFGSGI